MKTREQVAEVYVDILAKILETTPEEIAAQADSRMIEDMGMTSMQIFPLIGELVDQFDADISFADFLKDVHTINEGIDFVLKTVNQ